MPVEDTAVNHPANLGNRASVEVMVAKDEIDRLLDDLFDGAEVVANIAAFCNIAADCNDIGTISDGGKEIVEATSINEIQVDVS